MTDLKKYPKILVAGIGNIFKADDGFGVEVVRRLIGRETIRSAHVVDFGIRGLDLGYALLDDQYEAVVLVDVVKRGHSPGTLYLLDIDSESLGGDSRAVLAETHGMHPAKVLAWVKAMGGTLPILRLVGCEPEDVCDDEDDLQMGLSAAVAQAVDEAVRRIETLVAELEDLTQPGPEVRSHA
jgi:hydrogenase maturation protease